MLIQRIRYSLPVSERLRRPLESLSRVNAGSTIYRHATSASQHTPCNSTTMIDHRSVFCHHRVSTRWFRHVIARSSSAAAALHSTQPRPETPNIHTNHQLLKKNPLVGSTWLRGSATGDFFNLGLLYIVLLTDDLIFCCNDVLNICQSSAESASEQKS